MKIKILGTGCYNCIKLETLIHDVLTELNKSDIPIIRIDDEHIIRKYMPIDQLPGLVINETLVCTLDLPDRDTLKAWLQNSGIESA